MEDLNRIYLKNVFFTSCAFMMGLVLPYAKGNSLAMFLLIILAIILYRYIGNLLIDVIKRLSHQETSLKELKFFFITLVILCAGGYFFIGVLDAEEQMLSGLREIKLDAEYELYSVEGFFTYFNDLIFTYLNSLYYSIVVMATLGDSKIVVEGSFTRLIVAFEVVTALTLTIFKIGEYYSELSAVASNQAENRIVSEVKKINPKYVVDPKAGFWERTFVKLTIKSGRSRKARG
ncbi:MAG: ion channel [Methylophaga sp.]|uniref:ion channel n=1 Tax=Methylophaga sp. TaxID=2024840 RepID=UPI00299E27F7|nr:ion channel [Methylophaga sp.]MDX1750351.1 ion channel [Methylophaga sp.]